MPARWEIRLAGQSLVVGADGTRSDLSAKSKAFALLVFLAVPAPRRVRRDELLAALWPEADAVRARGALRATLYQLRQSLGKEAIGGSGE